MLSFLLSLFATLLHTALILAGAPLIAGIFARCQARLAGHPGTSWLQPYFDLAKLLQKQTLIPDTATDLYPAWPYINLAASAAATVLVPSFCTGMISAPASDFLAFAGLLALASAAAWAGGLETGGAAAGAAVSRDLPFIICAAGAWAPAVLTLVLIAHNPTIDAAVTAIRMGPSSITLPLAIAIAAGITPTLAQPHGQAAMRLEYSGRYLLLFNYAAMLRLIALLSLFSALICPFGIGRAASILTWPAGLILWAIKLLLLCAACALARTALPPFRAPGVLIAAAVLGVISAILLFSTFPGTP